MYSFEIQVSMLNQVEYAAYCLKKNAEKRTIMCKPIERIQNMSAQQLLEYCGQEDAVPVDLNAILRKVGISALPMDFTEMEAQYRKMDGVSPDAKILGLTATKNDNAAIFYSEKYKKDSHRCRFTIAHELAHCCLSDPGLRERGWHLEFRTDEEPNEDEMAANVFAGELLIPKKKLYEIIDQLLLPSVYTLAKVFDVADTVMLARLKYLRPNESIVGYNY